MSRLAVREIRDHNPVFGHSNGVISRKIFCLFLGIKKYGTPTHWTRPDDCAEDHILVRSKVVSLSKKLLHSEIEG